MNESDNKEINVNGVIYVRKKEIFGWKFYKVRKFDSPKSLEDFGLERPPQSWCYTEDEINGGKK